ncbi:MAG: UDP-N-acetylmuramate:L-alanyl-gamma-D-glutamyl-meso-diaminopimelate ligase [Verrucomicrobiae bacterium]|nr:UDP-N-acetylmuramate:L-alanyl-gamma-D-glutamyl-meso-diaminopimelate ligase [Verrucomicrobiae bacterium]NNJ42830.1 UDP-N-acetylmuramate:L-alanyl-gamma-D-glutamyl-meso-diaminopimelate ligase [Akkermansiaceae bacterium]
MQHIHFIGICGTAMGSVAAAMHAKGFTVTGSDENVYPPMSTFLEQQGVRIFPGFKADNIPASADVIVVGNAISRGNEEAEAALERKLLYVSLPEILKEHFLRGKRNLVVSGTHGKTTTSSLLAWLLKSAGVDPSHMIGGIPRNLGKGAAFTDSDFVVLEGDEYDTAFFDKRSKFLHYLPEVVIINNIEFDHADIYDSLDEIKLTFKRLLNIVPRNGIAFVNGDCPNSMDVSSGAPAPIKTVGLGDHCDLRITEVDYGSELTSFDLDGETYALPMAGEFNVRNAAMAICTARFSGFSADQIRAGLLSFEGIARRQEVRGVAGGVRVIDDFAHHPTAIALAIDSLRQQYPDSRVWVIFEPRSNTTRRNIFQNELAVALSKADLAVVPAVPDPEKVAVEDRLDPALLVRDVEATGTRCWFCESVADIVDLVAQESQEGDTVAVLTNGGFGGIHQKLLDRLEP